jgi:hypothetical protein
MAKKAVKWFKPKVHSGWRKTLTPRGRRVKALKAHRGNLLSTARSLGALANASKDKQTVRLARADSKYFYKKYKEKKK